MFVFLQWNRVDVKILQQICVKCKCKMSKQLFIYISK